MSPYIKQNRLKMYKKRSLGKYINIGTYLYDTDMRDRCIMKYHAKYYLPLEILRERKIILLYIFENTNLLLNINIDYIV